MQIVCKQLGNDEVSDLQIRTDEQTIQHYGAAATATATATSFAASLLYCQSDGCELVPPVSVGKADEGYGEEASMFYHCTDVQKMGWEVMRGGWLDNQQPPLSLLRCFIASRMDAH